MQNSLPQNTWYRSENHVSLPICTSQHVGISSLPDKLYFINIYIIDRVNYVLQYKEDKNL